MGKPTGFLEFERQASKKRSVKERLRDFKEVEEKYDEKQTLDQASRCMDCGIPFCHNGCPLGNIIPEFNDAVYEQNWELAYQILDSTNNFPEFTGRICPAPCESSCVLGINKPPVSIEYIEKSIIEKAFENGWVTPRELKSRTDKKVAIVGSGPAGLAAAVQLNRAGHKVVVYERADQIGGLLRYGIPDFKLDKGIIDRRMEVMREEGIEFKTGINVGVDVKSSQLMRDYDAILLAGGSTRPRDLKIEGRNLNGVHFAMEFLSQQNKKVALGKGIEIDNSVDHTKRSYNIPEISAKGKHVVVIGGGDTGSDCVGTSNRQGAASVLQIEIMEKPGDERDERTPWPQWPLMLRTSTSHEEGCVREWLINTEAFIGDEKGNLKALKIVEVAWNKKEDGSMKMEPVKGTEKEIPCDLALIAAGFVGPEKTGFIEELDLEIDEKRDNVIAKDYQTSNEKVFVAGDMRRGQSLVVWAISEGREAARSLDAYLSGGKSALESKTISMFSPEYLSI